MCASNCSAPRRAFAPGLPFFPLLRQYPQRFSRLYGLQVELSAPGAARGAGLEPAVEVQLLRIIQEALSNVRKHRPRPVVSR